MGTSGLPAAPLRHAGEGRNLNRGQIAEVGEKGPQYGTICWKGIILHLSQRAQMCRETPFDSDVLIKVCHILQLNCSYNTVLPLAVNWFWTSALANLSCWFSGHKNCIPSCKTPPFLGCNLAVCFRKCIYLSLGKELWTAPTLLLVDVMLGYKCLFTLCAVFTASCNTFLTLLFIYSLFLLIHYLIHFPMAYLEKFKLNVSIIC